MTTEDNKDQGALTVMASAIGATMILRKSPREIAEAGLSALAEAGYSVVKTEWEWFEGQRRHKAIPAGHWIPVPEGGEQ